MAFSLQTYSRFSGRIDNQLTKGGSLEVPVTISVTGNVYNEVATVANGANTTIYNDDLGTFTYLYLASDFNTRAKITDTNSNTFSIQLRGTGEAAKYGIPLTLGLDETTDASNTINTIQVFNTSGSSAKIFITVIL